MSQHESEMNKQSWPQSLILLGLVTLLFWEWLRPLPILTDTQAIEPFILFFAFVLVIHFLRLKWVLRTFLIGFVMIYFIHHLYIPGPFFDKEWILYFRDDLLYSFSLLFELDIYNHSFFVRTFVFFILLWYVASYLYTTVIVKQRTLAFFFLTIVFLAVSDTFSPFQAQMSIFRAVIIGFGLLAMGQITRVLNQVPFRAGKGRSRFPYPWLASGIAVIVFFSSLAYVAPKAAPSWPDPVSFLKGYSESVGTGSGIGRIQKVGYGNNDEVLGGGFIQDDALVFEASTDERHYWRGESKDEYTGRGWRNSLEIEEVVHPDDIAETIDMHNARFIGDQVETDPIRSEVRFAERRYSTVFYPGDLVSVEANPKSGFAMVDMISGNIRMLKDEGGSPIMLREYSLETEYPRYSTVALKEATMEAVPQDMQERYTQLPDTLPDRVGQLAREITKEHASPYDKVKEIEGFFRRNGYQYDTEDVPVPGKDEDYVDQFLFETQRGYCDNFSTSMVVMLRTIDIPARWVKGFTSGDIVTRDGDRFITEVRNKNAHSWVEVYFPEIGWVPFEPTRTFYNPYTFERDDLEDSESNDPTSPAFDPLEGELEGLEQGDMEFDLSAYGGGSSNDHWYQSKGLLFFLSLIVLSLAAFLVIFWKNIILSWAIIRYRQTEGNQWVIKSYELLIRYLGRFVMKREPSQTMREYVLQLEPKFETGELRPLTKMFEDVRYGYNKENQNVAHKAYDLWKTIMQKMRS
jgi:transglutaminase-like putative cysteine protease